MEFKGSAASGATVQVEAAMREGRAQEDKVLGAEVEISRIKLVSSHSRLASPGNSSSSPFRAKCCQSLDTKGHRLACTK